MNILRFLRSRVRGSLWLARRDAEVVLLPTFPYTLGQMPWVVEIEDVVTLFSPFIRNGTTRSLDILRSPWYLPVKALLESPNCRAILCHVRSTATSIPRLFRSQILREKTIYVPLALSSLPILPERPESMQRPPTLLFTNSWNQGPQNFYVRGGPDVIEAYARLVEAGHRVRLILRTGLPADLDPHYVRLIDRYEIEVIDRFLSEDEMAAVMRRADIFVLPAARVHVVSLLQAMAYGLVVVVSDGWGMEEYVEHGRTGLVVRGRYGRTSWLDENGMLREDYGAMRSGDPDIVNGLVEVLSALIRDRALRNSLARAAREAVQTRFTVARWNEGLALALGKGTGNAARPPGAVTVRTPADALDPH